MNFDFCRYPAKVSGVYDGDTITTSLYLGLDIVQQDVKIRLYGIDAPEVRGRSRKAGLVSRDFLRDLVLDKEIVVETLKDSRGKYGRLLGILWTPIEDDYMNVNELMVQEGYAEFREY